MAGGYTFHQSYHEALKARSPEERLALYDAMSLYAFEATDTEFYDPNLAMAWSLIKPNLDASLKRSKTNADNARKRSVKATSKTTVPATVKTVAKPTAKTSVETPVETVALPESLGEEWSGVEKENLSLGKKDSPSSRAGDGAAAAKAAPPLPKGWEATGCICTHSGCRENQLRGSNGELWCPACDRDALREMGVIS